MIVGMFGNTMQRFVMCCMAGYCKFKYFLFRKFPYRRSKLLCRLYVTLLQFYPVVFIFYCSHIKPVGFTDNGIIAG